MGKWYQLFSWWGFVLWILWQVGIKIVAPRLILTTNFIFTFIAGLIHPPIDTSVFFFILFSHAVPAWFARNQPLDVFGSLVVFMMYLISLRIQGTDLWSQWIEMWNEPPKTIKDYLKNRGVL